MICSHVDADPGGVRFIPCKTGKYNTSFFVEGGPEPMVLRIAPVDDPSQHLFYEYRMMRQEPGLHALLRTRTRVPVPQIIAHDESRERIDRDYLLMERMPGQPISEVGLSRQAVERLLRQVGECLRSVHAMQSDRYGYLGEHQPMEPQADWGAAFAILWNRLLDDIERCGGYARDEGAEMRSLLDRHRRVFERDVPASLLHMDVWAENILADHSGTLTGIIDWDRALWGDPEIEFAVLDYCGISEPAFWEGYGAPRDSSPDAETRRLFYLLYELQKYIFIRRVRGNSPAAGDRYRLQALRLAQELGG